MLEDPFHLERYVIAQKDTYAQALSELRRGQKQTHWMWFVFPQFDGLASSHTARFYAIKSTEEAEAYLHHPVLGLRLLESFEVILAIEGKAAKEILGFPDDLKLRSSATLFSVLPPHNPVFSQVIARFYEDGPDQRTLELVGMYT